MELFRDLGGPCEVQRNEKRCSVKEEKRERYKERTILKNEREREREKNVKNKKNCQTMADSSA